MELSDFAEAAAAALAELGEATPDAPPPALPAETDQADSPVGQADDAVVEQPSAESDVQEFDFDLDDTPTADEAEEVDPFETIDWDEVAFELPGVEEPVTLQELQDGYLRQADYTRKTQQLADERKAADKAVRLWEALQDRPVEVVRALAVEAGLISADDQPAAEMEFSPIRTADQVEAEVQRRVDEALRQHPAVLEAESQRALSMVESEFARIEQTHGVKLSANARQHLLRVAAQSQVPDLELVFRAEKARQEDVMRARTEARSAAPSKPSGNRQTNDRLAPADSFEEAAQRALVELGIG